MRCVSSSFCFLSLTLIINTNYNALKIVEGPEIQKELTSITGQKTVPFIFINGHFIGGNSDLQDLVQKGKITSTSFIKEGKL